jgi:predicted ATPase
VITLYDPQQHRSYALYGIDLGVGGRGNAALALWLLGYPDQARERMRDAYALAHDLSHLQSVAFVLSYAAMLHQFRREGHAAQERAEAAVALSNEQGFPFYLVWGTILQGWVLTEQEHGEQGIAQIRQGLASYGTMGAEVYRPYFLALLAETHEKVGQTEEGLNVLAEALDRVDKTGERWYEAELYRLRGELTLAQSKTSLGQVQDKSQTGQDQSQASLKQVVGKSEDTSPQPLIPSPQSEAEACFLKAIEIARKQQAKSLELRAVVSLSRLWQSQDKKEEARQMLAEIYTWFTEGFDTKDLQDAKASLEELSQ